MGDTDRCVVTRDGVWLETLADMELAILLWDPFQRIKEVLGGPHKFSGETVQEGDYSCSRDLPCLCKADGCGEEEAISIPLPYNMRVVLR